MLLEQGTALPLGHTAPHSELDAIVEGVGSTLGYYRAVPTNHGGLALRGTPHKELIGVGRSTQRFGHPGDPGLRVRPLERTE